MKFCSAFLIYVIVIIVCCCCCFYCIFSPHSVFCGKSTEELKCNHFAYHNFIWASVFAQLSMCPKCVFFSLFHVLIWLYAFKMDNRKECTESTNLFRLFPFDFKFQFLFVVLFHRHHCRHLYWTIPFKRDLLTPHFDSICAYMLFAFGYSLMPFNFFSSVDEFRCVVNRLQEQQHLLWRLFIG